MLKKKLFLFALFVLLLFALLSYQSIKGKSRFIDFPIYPLRLLEQASSAVTKKINNIIHTYIIIIGKEAENRRLLKEIEHHKAEKNRVNELERENERLRKILKLKSTVKTYVATADVIARDPTNWFQTFWINKGENSGIAKDMVAVTPTGPVGKVNRIFEGESSITLLNDVNSLVAARLQPSRIEGMLEGRGGELCRLKYVSKEAEVKPGEKIITSGLDGIYPEGLLIGYVAKIKKEEGEMFQGIDVSLAQDLFSVEEVIILKK
ncbi:MAG: rod shape-determining protein MreC [Nitrospiraceae bacterium]|nr:MAG: rod shape-determining protein MreC [Nitrospiraceae bacterium]